MSFFRPQVDRLSPYLPGEQPQELGWVKLNTNENPYPPSPQVAEAVAVASRRLNVYPDPLGTSFRQAAGELFGLEPDWFLPANGSDENLTLLLRSFVDTDDIVAFPYPSYILYETLAQIQAGQPQRMLLNRDWSWDLNAVRPQVEQARLVFIPNPNSPSGNRWSDETLLSLVPPKGILVIDEAYGDFADEPHRMELLKSNSAAAKQIIVTRTLSKSYSLAGLRFGFAIAHPDLIAGMRKVKDSYNCDSLSLAAAEAAIRDQPFMLANRQKIIHTRARLAAALRTRGFHVQESQANFLWVTHTDGEHRARYEFLKSNKILVRYMRFPEAAKTEPTTIDGLRITIGNDGEIDRLLEVLVGN